MFGLTRLGVAGLELARRVFRPPFDCGLRNTECGLKNRRSIRNPQSAFRNRKVRTRLWIEPLEARTLFAVSIAGTILDDFNGAGVPGITVYLDQNHNGVLDTRTVRFEGATTLVQNRSFAGPRTLSPELLNVSGLPTNFLDLNVELHFTRTAAGANNITSVVLASPVGLALGNGPFLFNAVAQGRSFNGTLDDEAANAAAVTAFPVNPGVLTGNFRPVIAFNRPGRWIYGNDPNGGWALIFNHAGTAVPAGLTLQRWALVFTIPETSTTTDANGNYSFSDLPDGTYPVRVATAAGSHPVEQVTVPAVPPPAQQDFVVTPAPDLLGSSFRVVTPPTSWGQQVQVAYAITNQGVADAGPFDVEVRLSPDSVVGTEDPIVGTVRVTDLAALSTTTDTLTIHLPASPPTGLGRVEDATLGLRIDPGSEVAEVKEDNNSNRGSGLDLAALASPANSLVTSDQDQPDESDPAAQQQPSLAVNPLNANHLVMAYMDYGRKTNGYAGIGVAVSRDGGMNWTRTAVPLPPNVDEAAGYPVVRFNHLGEVFLTFMATTFTGEHKPPLIFPDGTVDPDTDRLFRSYGLESRNGIYLSYSTNGGDAWSNPILVSNDPDPAPAGSARRRWDVTPDLWVDTAATSANRGILYASWTRIYPAGQFPVGTTGTGNGFTDILFAFGTVTRDAQNQITGVNWTVRFQANGASVIRDNSNRDANEGGGFSQFPHITSDRAGNLLLALNSGGAFIVYISPAGTRGGLFVLRANAPFGVGSQGVNRNRFTLPDSVLYDGAPPHNFPVTGILADPVRPGTVYAYEAAFVGNNNFNPVQIDKGDINFAYTLDAGVQWERYFTVGGERGNVGEIPANLQGGYRSALNDDNLGRFLGLIPAEQKPDEVITTQALPRLAVDAQGNLVAIWYDLRRDTPGGPPLLDVYGSTSTDLGRTWSANYRVTDVSFAADGGPFEDAGGNLTPFLGDSLALATAGGFVYAAWTDTRNGNQDIYFARYLLRPPPGPSGDRFEPNEDDDSATVLGDISALQTLPGLVLGDVDEDWYELTPTSGRLLVSASATQGGEQYRLELYDEADTLLAESVALLDGSGNVIGQQLSAAVTANTPVFLRVTREAGVGALTYTLSLQSLTEDLGTQVHGTRSGTPELGTQAVYALTTAVGGSVRVALTPAATASGPFTLEILDDSGRPLSSQPATIEPGATGTIEIPVAQGQTVLLRVARPVAGAQDGFTLEFTNFDQFQAAQNRILFFPTRGNPTTVAAADITNDQQPDVVAASLDFVNPISVLQTDTTGLLGAPRGFDAGPGALNVATGGFRSLVLDDFSGDQVPDVAVTNFQSADVSILFSRLDGTLAPERRFDAVARSDALASANFNNDGSRDLVVLERLPDPNAPGTSSRLAVLLGRDDGTFAPPAIIDTTLQRSAVRVVVADFNDDGNSDLAVFSSNEPVIEIHFGRGDGTFDPLVTRPAPENTAAAVAVDLNNDQQMDLVTGGTNSGRVFVLLGNGDGTFQAAQSFFANTDSVGAATLIAGLVVVNSGSPGGFGTPDPGGPLDVLVVAIPRIGGGSPHINFLPGLAGPGSFNGFGAPQRVAASRFSGPLAVADLNGDSALDVIAADVGGVRVVYGVAPTIAPNTTQQAARNLGTVVHLVTPRQVIVPGFADAWFTLTVPTEAVPGAGDEVIDFSTLFEHLEFPNGPGLAMEVLDANGNVLGSGPSFRIRAAQGQVLTLHVFGVADPNNPNVRGSGAYTLSINVLPQVVQVEAPSLLPGLNDQAGGPISTLVITFQGDRLDPVTAEDPANYRITWLGPDGQLGGGDDQELRPGGPVGGRPIVYAPGANTVASSGRTFPTAVRQTVTLFFTDPLPAGSYLIEVSSDVQTADFNPGEDALLAAVPGSSGHPVVSLVNNQITAGSSRTEPNLVQPVGQLGDLSVFEQGTTFLTQFHGNLGALLNALQDALGDAPGVSDGINTQILDSFLPGAGGVSFLIIWLDPVSVRLADPQGARAVYDLQTNTLTNTLARAFIEVGGNIEVLVLPGVLGTFTLNIADVLPQARGGAVVIDSGGARSVSLTDAIRAGERQFQFTVAGPQPPPPPIIEPPPPTMSNPSGPQSIAGSFMALPFGPGGNPGPIPGPGGGGGGGGAGTISTLQNLTFLNSSLVSTLTLLFPQLTTVTLPGQTGPGDTDAARGTGSNDPSVANPPSPGGEGVRGPRTLEELLRELGLAGVRDLGSISPSLMGVLDAILEWLRQNRSVMLQRGAALPRPQPAEGEVLAAPEPLPPPMAEQADEGEDVIFREESPADLLVQDELPGDARALLSAAVFAAGFCRDWGAEQIAERRARRRRDRSDDLAV